MHLLALQGHIEHALALGLWQLCTRSNWDGCYSNLLGTYSVELHAKMHAAAAWLRGISACFFLTEKTSSNVVARHWLHCNPTSSNTLLKVSLQQAAAHLSERGLTAMICQLSSCRQFNTHMPAINPSLSKTTVMIRRLLNISSEGLCAKGELRVLSGDACPCQAAKGFWNCSMTL